MRGNDALLAAKKLVLARPAGLKVCDTCGYSFNPSYAKVTTCPVCRADGANLAPRRCAYSKCEVIFQPLDGSAKYHSDSCRQMSFVERKKKRLAAEANAA